MDTKPLTAPIVGTGLLMALYLLLRPYGDAADPTSLTAAEAFASRRWLASHVAGMLAIASIGRLAMRLHGLKPSSTTRAARSLGLAGVVLVLPYYGAETFALHALGGHAVATGDPGALALVAPIRDGAVAMTMFGAGLLMLAATGVLLGVVGRRLGWMAWPLGVMIALLLPQFFLPPVGRMAFGALYAVAAAVLLASVLRPAAVRDSVEA